MKLLTANQFRDWDAYTILHEPIASIELMERAATNCSNFISSRFNIEKPIKVFCAKGNNGGDGLAIARQLINKGYQVSVYILELGKIGSSDFQMNLHQLHKDNAEIHFLQNAEAFPKIDPHDLLIDALYGTGLRGSLMDLSKEMVQYLNDSKACIYSIDLPSGLLADQSSFGNPIVKANTTICFEGYKRCLLADENAPYFGTVEIISIQLIPNFLETINSEYELIDQDEISHLIKPRNAYAHKGKFGHALLIAGNTGKMGAAVLSAKSALRSGLGLLTVSVPNEYNTVIHQSVPEAMLIARENPISDFEKYTAIAIGPGLGTDDKAATILESLIQNFKHPILLDADAISILSNHAEWLLQLPAGSILTPHPKEFDRMFGKSTNDFERWDKAIALSIKYPLIILVKGHHTLIAANGIAFYNSSGNSGLAKAGSGDTLTGIITAFLAQKYQPLDAVKIGVYLHGLAADLALEKQSMESLLASDTIEYLGAAFKKLKSI